jgi:hypothetical protein
MIMTMIAADLRMVRSYDKLLFNKLFAQVKNEVVLVFKCPDVRELFVVFALAHEQKFATFDMKAVEEICSDIFTGNHPTFAVQKVEFIGVLIGGQCDKFIPLG